MGKRDIPDYCTVIFTYITTAWKPDKRLKKLWEAVDSCGVIVEFAKQDQKDLIAWATSFAQAGRSIKAYGTTHADFSNHNIPCTRGLTKAEVEGEYELNTGKVIVECFENEGINPNDCPAVLIHRHGPFCWGKSCFKAVENALILEEVAKMAFRTEEIAAVEQKQVGIEDYLLAKHYNRKHGKNAYYGQK